MYLRPMSDLHLEIQGRSGKHCFELPALDTDQETVLVLAGDTDRGVHAVDFALRLSERFLAVVLVPGNHEFYKGAMPHTLDKMRARLTEAGESNVHLLDNDIVEIAGTRFIGATLWTDFDAGNPEAMQAARLHMNDFRRIRTGTASRPYQHPITPGQVLEWHQESRDRLFEQVRAARVGEQPCVVVTHHAPSYRFIPMSWRKQSVDLSAAYASDLDRQIEAEGPDLWIFGHIHACADETIGRTRLLANPRGYLPKAPVADFNPSLRVKLAP